MSKSTTTTEWRTITVEDRSGMVPVTHTFAVEIIRETYFLDETKPPRLESASIELAAYPVSDGTDSHAITHMGGSYQGGLDPEYTLTGGTMVVAPDYRGLHIGTYLQNEVVRWAIETVKLPGRIKPIAVAPEDARTEAERDRRNQFYEQFGIRFAWTTNTPLPCVGGTSLTSLTLADVHTVGVIEGVAARSLTKALALYARRARVAEERNADDSTALRLMRERHDVELHLMRRLAGVCACVAGLALAALATFWRFH